MKGKEFNTAITGYSKDRRKLDKYFTPSICTELLLDNESFSITVLEPSCGDGAISKVLKSRGYVVYSQDIEPEYEFAKKFDFIDDEILNSLYKNHDIITNPPYSVFDKFVLKAKKVAYQKI